MTMDTAAGARPTFDLLDPEFYRSNPHESWAWMRVNEPVYRDDRNGLWGVTRHKDIQDVERRSSVFVSGLGYRANWSPDEINMIAQRVQADSFQPVPVFITTAVIYLILTTALTQFSTALEERMAASPR